MQYLDLHVKEIFIRETLFLRKKHLPKARVTETAIWILDCTVSIAFLQSFLWRTPFLT